MTDSTEKPGGQLGGQEDTEQQAQLARIILNQMGEQMVGEVLAFSPGLNPQQTLTACMRSLLAHHEGALNPVLGDAVAESPMRTERDLWGFRLRRGSKVVSQMVVRKDVAELAKTNPNEFVGWLAVFGALTNPKVLAFARAHGYELEFFQSKSSRIIT